MPPSRFSQVSRYRNATLTVSKADARYSELGLSVPAAASSSAEHSSTKKVAVAPHSGHVIIKTSASPGSFAVLSEAGFGKFAKRPPGIDVGVHVVDFDVGAFQGNNSDDDFVLATVASGSTGEVIVDRIVGLPNGTHDGKFEVRNLKKFRADEDVGMVRFCPAVDGVLATASPSHGTVRIWDVEQGTCVAKLDNGSAGLWSFDWSTDGRTLATASKDGQLRLWDLASGQCQCTASFAPHHASKLKPTRVAFVSVQSAHLLLTTGFGAMRQREVAVWDTRDVAVARKRTSLDVSTAPLEPYVERDRGLVYLVSRGDASMRWIDVGSTDQGGPNAFAEGHFSLLDVVPTGSAAVCAPSRYDTTCGEVARLVVCSYSSTGSAASSDSVVPVSVRVPRRQYIDFHQDLYPETVWRGPGSGRRNAGTSWVDGIGKPLATLSLDPATRSKDEASLATTAKDSAPLSAAPSATTSNDSSTAGGAAPTNPSKAKQPEATAVAAIAAPATGPSLDYKVPPVAKPALGTTEATAAAAAAAAPAVPAATSVIRPPKMQQDEKPTASSQQWSRRFLAGGTPLVPAYQNLTAVDVSRSADARMLAASPKHFFVPISGPGGRLAIFPLSKTGRVSVHLPCFVHGAALGDFATDPFDDAMVYTSAADGNLRAWKVPSTVDKDEKEQTEGGITVEKPERTVKLPGSATRVLQLAVHPNVKGLVAVVVASSDHIGSPLIYLVDFEGEQILSSVKSTEELVATAGLFGAEWSPDGSVLALAGKDRKLYLIDVRVPDGQIRVFGQAPAHDSPRSFRIVWLDGNHIVTVGHGQGSSRQLKLFAIDFLSSASLSEVSRCPLDVSPALLFPHWDVDTSILYLWSKGERIVHAYEIHPDQQQQQQQRSNRAGLAVAAGQQQTWLQLPQFQHGEAQLGLAWLGKDSVDVKAVEVATSIRLCRTEAQRVGWKITRSRPEFFQDDVFPPTRLQRQPLLSTTEWLRGDDGGVGGSGLHPRVSIKPDGMIPLSQAPPASLRQSKLPKGPVSREKTAEEREQEALDEVFERAKKNDEGAKDVFDSEGARRAPDDDDWGDSD